MKQELALRISEILEEKYVRAKENFESIRESLTSESKSTAGDKHETGRAMVQLELEQAGKVLRETELVLNSFQKIPLDGSPKISPGSLIHTDSGIFFISVPLGKITIGNTDVFCIGIQAPLYQLFAGKQPGDTIAFGKQSYVIASVE